MGLYDAIRRAFTSFLDDDAYSFKIINTTHAKVHEGIFYSYYFKGTVGDGESKDFLIVTDADYCVHFRVEDFCCALSNVDLLIYEEPTVTTGNEGTPVTVINRNRESTNEANLLVYEDPTFNETEIGDLIGRLWVGGGSDTPVNSFGGNEESNREMILAAGTKYIVRVTNNNNSDSVVFVKCSGYEVAE